jgi:DNA-binding IclR family transcriptional regulator
MSRLRSDGEGETVQAVTRALSILEALADVAGPISITELAKKVDLKLATVHRLLTTLMHENFVDQDTQTMRYSLGIKVFEMGNSAIASMDIRSAAHPFLKELLEKVNETTNLAILDGHEVVYIDQLESTHVVIVKMFARIGSRGAAYCTGSGKALLAGLSDEELLDVMDNIQFNRYTDHTITSKKALLREIQKIREEGYAVDDAERDEGVCCVAVPVRNHEGKAIAAVSISGPNTRVNPGSLEIFIHAVKETAADISGRLGYRG